VIKDIENIRELAKSITPKTPVERDMINKIIETAVTLKHGLSYMENKLSHTENLLSEALDIMDNVHLYDTDLFREISAHLYGEEE